MFPTTNLGLLDGVWNSWFFCVVAEIPATVPLPFIFCDVAFPSLDIQNANIGWLLSGV